MVSNVDKKGISVNHWRRDDRGYTYASMSDGALLVRHPRNGQWGHSNDINPKTGEFRTAFDSGQVSAFRPAQYVKPQGLIRRVSNALQALAGRPLITTEQGASSASSPLTFYLSLWEQRFSRRSMIEDCRSLFLSDPRVYRAFLMYVFQATRGGFTINVLNDNNRGKKAKKVAENLMKILPPQKLRGWGLGLMLEGDLFTQFVIGENRQISAIKRMPAISMERLTDDADEIIDPRRAFAQLDSLTFEEFATFTEELMCHTRWNWIDGDRYGTSDCVTVRRAAHYLELMEDMQRGRRMGRASLRLHHKIGVPGSIGNDKAVTNYQALNGMVEGDIDAQDPMTALRDYFSDGNVEIKAIEGDTSIEKIDDIRYFQALLCAGLPTPGVFYGVDIDSVNRDVVEDMRELWLQSCAKLQEAESEVITHGFKLGCAQHDIDAELLEWSIDCDPASIERPGEHIDWLVKGTGGPVISEETGVKIASRHTKVPDVEKELEKVRGDRDRAVEGDVKRRAAGKTVKDEMDDEGVKLPKSNGKAPRAAGAPASKN